MNTFIKEQKALGREIVAIIGIGFVGSAMAAVCADARSSDGNAYYGVVGIDLPGEAHRWKIDKMNAGVSPIQSEDPLLDQMIHEAALDRKNLIATSSYEALSHADVIIVDINLDVDKVSDDYHASSVRMDPFENAIRQIGKTMKPNALLMIETTVPPGTTEHVILPILEKELRGRNYDGPIHLAHAYERVMPGKNYINSIKNYWRVHSSVNDESEKKVSAFLSTVINVDEYPLVQMRSPRTSELSKVLENSYRAMNIAFIYEWTLAAEAMGVNLFEVIQAIRMRKGTHNNIMKPGVGVGGYCLTKDAIVAQWGIQKFFNDQVSLDMSLEALQINDHMPLHIVDLVNNHFHGELENKKILLCGVSYIENVDDTRNTPTKVIYDALQKRGAQCIVHDPIVGKTDVIPSEAFRKDLNAAINESDAVLFLVRHDPYLNWSIDKKIIDLEEKLFLDGFDILTDEKIKDLLRQKAHVLGVGKGHIPELKEEKK